MTSAGSDWLSPWVESQTVRVKPIHPSFPSINKLALTGHLLCVRSCVWLQWHKNMKEWKGPSESIADLRQRALDGMKSQSWKPGEGSVS